jgi:uncharacterized protein (DUF362 family)
MRRTIGRREFIKAGAGAGLTLAFGRAMIAAPGTLPARPPVVGVGVGEDGGKAAAKAVALAGGMRSFIRKGATVALLPNVQSRHPGSYTKPEILRAVIGLCRKAGAKRVDCLSWQTVKQWEDTGLKAVLDAEKAGLRLFEKDEDLFKPVPIPDGVALKEARVLTALFEYDALINMPITKDHAGNKFTGAMKNLMGLNSPGCNRTFHKPNWKTDPDDIAHLDQCIVDLNKAVKPVLNVIDATEFIVSNGPFGPGQLFTPQKVVVGTDRVALDAYCASLWGLKPSDIVQIRKGSEQGLGQIDLGKVSLKEDYYY